MHPNSFISCLLDMNSQMNVYTLEVSMSNLTKYVVGISMNLLGLGH